MQIDSRSCPAVAAAQRTEIRHENNSSNFSWLASRRPLLRAPETLPRVGLSPSAIAWGPSNGRPNLASIRLLAPATRRRRGCDIARGGAEHEIRAPEGE